MRSKDGLLTEKVEVAKEFKNIFERRFNLSTQNGFWEKVTTVEEYLEKPSKEVIE